MAGDDGSAPPCLGSESSVILLYESPMKNGSRSRCCPYALRFKGGCPVLLDDTGIKWCSLQESRLSSLLCQSSVLTDKLNERKCCQAWGLLPRRFNPCARRDMAVFLTIIKWLRRLGLNKCFSGNSRTCCH